MEINKLPRTLTVIVVTLSILLLVGIVFFSSLETLRQDRKAELDTRTNIIEDRIRDNFSLFNQKLQSGVGLFTVEDTITPRLWNEFIDSTRTFETFIGVQGIGYSKFINANEKESFEEFAKNVYDPNFEIYPEGQRDVYSAIILIQPRDKRNSRAIGYDMYSEEARRTAMDFAKNTGDSYISNAVKLVQEIDKSEQPGFLMYAPHYSDVSEIDSVSSRQQNIEGYVYAVFRSYDYLSSLFNDRSAFEDIEFSIFAGENFGIELYKTANYDERVENGETSNAIISLPGVDWQISYAYQASSLTGSLDNNRPLNIIIYGTVIAALVGFMTFMLIRYRENQLKLFQERSINDAKDSLLSIASHQLRTPASGVKQYLGMVLQGFSGDITTEQEKLLYKAFESNERQLKTINDVLYLARLDSGRIILSSKKVNVCELITSVLDEIHESLKLKNHKLKKDLPKRNVFIKADEHTLRMCIENLLTNAIKYTRENGRITIQLKNYKDKITFSVKDNGVGIEKEEQENIFKQFYRVDNELSKSTTGTGVGLYLTKKLVELHGGSIKVESDKDEGSTFTINIPKL